MDPRPIRSRMSLVPPDVHVVVAFRLALSRQEVRALVGDLKQSRNFGSLVTFAASIAEIGPGKLIVVTRCGNTGMAYTVRSSKRYSAMVWRLLQSLTEAQQQQVGNWFREMFHI